MQAYQVQERYGKTQKMDELKFILNNGILNLAKAFPQDIILHIKAAYLMVKREENETKNILGIVTEDDKFYATVSQTFIYSYVNIMTWAREYNTEITELKLCHGYSKRNREFLYAEPVIKEDE